MKLTAKDLYDLKVIDKVIREPKEMNDEGFSKVTANLKKEIKSELAKLEKLTKEEIVQNRYEKFRNISGFKNKEEKDVIRK